MIKVGKEEETGELRRSVSGDEDDSRTGVVKGRWNLCGESDGLDIEGLIGSRFGSTENCTGGGREGMV